MEDVLEVYGRAYDKNHPVVCFDESAKQLVSEIRHPYIGLTDKVRFISAIDPFPSY